MVTHISTLAIGANYHRYTNVMLHSLDRVLRGTKYKFTVYVTHDGNFKHETFDNISIITNKIPFRQNAQFPYHLKALAMKFAVGQTQQNLMHIDCDVIFKHTLLRELKRSTNMGVYVISNPGKRARFLQHDLPSKTSSMHDVLGVQDFDCQTVYKGPTNRCFYEAVVLANLPPKQMLEFCEQWLYIGLVCNIANIKHNSEYVDINILAHTVGFDLHLFKRRPVYFVNKPDMDQIATDLPNQQQMKLYLQMHNLV